MTQPSAKIVAHSKAPNGEELITMELEIHRFILSEVNTHRVLSRNWQSSRAVPVEKMIEQVRNKPAMPVHWGKNQRGMVAENEVDHSERMSAIHQWYLAAENAADQAEAINNLGIAKQVVNRLLEPFMWTKGVVTATREGFNSFFKLRCHPDAQPEIKLLAERMRKALDESVPQKLSYGEYHLPYADHGDVSLSIEDKVKVATSCCAQVSYRVLDDSLGKALKIYDMLNLPAGGEYPEDPPHFSPTEHVARVVDPEDTDLNDQVFMYDCGEALNNMSGNFSSISFWQYRKALEIGFEDLFLESA